MADYGVFNETTGLWVKSLTPIVDYDIEERSMDMTEELATAIAIDLSSPVSSFEREHPTSEQPHVPRRKWGRPGDRQEA